MSTLLIIEPHFDGHRGGYVAWIARAAADLGLSVKIATLSASLSHPLLSPLREALGESLELVVLDNQKLARAPKSVVSLILKEFRYWKLFKRLYSQIKASSTSVKVIVPYLDYCANAIAMFGSPFGVTQWYGIVMRQAFHFPFVGVKGDETSLRWVKYRLFRRLLNSRNMQSLFTIDESLVQFVSDLELDSADKLIYLRDPSPHRNRLDKDYSRSALGIRQDATVILVYGGISERKGIRELLVALNTLRGNEGVEVLVAGRQSEDIQEMINGSEFSSLVKSGRLHQINKYLDTEIEMLVFSAADIVWLGYRNFHMMSGVLVQAGQMSLPVIATSDGLIGRLAEIHDLGVTVDINDRYDVHRAIEMLAASPELRTHFGENGKMAFSAHTVSNFVDTIFRSKRASS